MSFDLTFSLCMIVKDEEKTIERCLNSVKKFIDEIIIVDTGSTDKTKEIAKKFDAKIYDFKWIDDFAAARNYSFSKATGDYILWLDGDDFIEEGDINKLIELKKTLDTKIDIVSMNYSLIRDSEGKTTYSLRRNRLVKRGCNFKWIGRIHEYLEVYGNSINADITINHGKVKEATNRNLRIFKDMEKKGEKFSERDLLYYANELYYNGKYKECIKVYEKFLKSETAWVEDRKTATQNLSRAYAIIGDEKRRIEVLVDSFKYDIPRADVVCHLAEIFLANNLVKQSIFWYKIALDCYHEKDNLGIDVKDYYTFIPAIQLCVCYSRIGDFEMAYYYNELCGIFDPGSPKYEYNRTYLNDKFKELGKPLPELKPCFMQRR